MSSHDVSDRSAAPAPVMCTSTDSGCFIIEELFTLGLEEIVQKIFLYLDPKRCWCHTLAVCCQGIFVSLKQCKRSCTLWREFIERRVWGSKSARRELHRKLVNRWRSEEPVRWDLSWLELQIEVRDYFTITDKTRQDTMDDLCIEAPIQHSVLIVPKC